MNGKVEEWLSEYKSNKAKGRLLSRFSKFLEWTGNTGEELTKLTSKQAKSLILQFQSVEAGKGTPNNSILAYISAAKLFFEYYEKPINFRRGQLVSPQKARGYHNFSNGDLTAMFQIANTQYKALIATGCSTGWGMGDILSLKKQKIEALIKRAKEQKQEFVFREETRQKTGSEALMVLNPLAIEWIEKWISQNPESKLFNVKLDAVNDMLKNLANRSGITLSGKIRSHEIRSWVINSLIKAGFASEEWKYVVGKSTPLSDATYLHLKEEIIQKYPKVYASHLCITASETKMAQSEIETLKKELEETKLLMKGMIAIYGQEIMEKAAKQLGVKRERASAEKVKEFLLETGRKQT